MPPKSMENKLLSTVRTMEPWPLELLTDRLNFSSQVAKIMTARVVRTDLC